MGKASKASIIRSVDPKVVEFVDAAAEGDVRKVRKLIKSGKIEIDDDVDGVTALMKACGEGHVPVIEELLGAGAGMWCVGPTDDPMTPFMWAACHGQLEVVRYFMEDVGMDEVGMNKGGGKSGRKTAMDYALDAGMHDDEKVVKKFQVLAYLSEKGAVYGEGVTDPQTVFDGAARGDVNYVHYCLEANGDMISSTHGLERSSLLHVAGNNGNFDLMKSLISHGADMEARDILDRTPIMSAAIAGQVGVLRYLMEQGVTLECRDATGNTALHHACEAGHLDCVRALLSRDVSGVNTEDVDEMSITKAILEGDAPEHQPPARQLAPCELLQMKNKTGHTPIVKAFAGGVHVGVIRYVVGAVDSNVDPVKAGQVGADAPSMLMRLLSTDGIELAPPAPEPEEATSAGKSDGGRSLFTCGADDDAEDEQDEEEEPEEVEEYKDEDGQNLDEMGAFPVTVPPGPSTPGHRRMQRFLDHMQTAVWGFDASKVMLISRPGMLAQNWLVNYQEAQQKRLLVKMSNIAPRANVLYVSHRWEAPGQADSQDNHTFMQLKRYLEEPAGESIHYIWIDSSCMDVEDKNNVAYDQYIVNVITAISRSTHLLAIPPCKIMDPRVLVRDMAIAKMAALHPSEVSEVMKKIPSAVSLKQAQVTSQNLRGFDINGVGNGSIARVVGSSTVASSKKVAAAERVVEEAVDAAILSRKASEPTKWAMIESDKLYHADGAAVDAGMSGAGGGDAKNGGGGGSNAAAAAVEGAKGSPDGGGGRALRPPSGTTGGAAGGGGKGGDLRRKSSGMTKVDGGKRRASGKKGAAAAAAAAAGASSVPGLTKKEKRALEQQEAKEHAAQVAEQATAEVSKSSMLLEEKVHYSDPAALLNRGWVEMEISLALIFGVQVQVCARWGPKVSFQTVLVKAVMTADGEAVEQGPGFRGAFLHAIGPISPTKEETKGKWWRTLFGAETSADPTVPVLVTYMPHLDSCHEPQTVVPPLVRASLALHDEGALLPFVAGDLDPVQVMYKLSGLALQDVKDGFTGLGPISDETDRVTLVRLYLLGLSYAMGLLPRSKKAAGKPKWQVQKDYKHEVERVRELEVEVESLRNRAPAAPPSKTDGPAESTPAGSGGCGCVVM